MQRLSKQIILKPFVLTVFLFSVPILFGQVIEIEKQEEVNEVLQELAEELEGLEMDVGDLKINFDNVGSVKLGIYLEDIDFEDAYEKHYPYCYGVFVSGLVAGGNGHKAGLVKGDIIMEFDGEKVLFEDHLISLRDSKDIGDRVELKIFRNEKILNKTLTFNPKQPEMDKNGKVITYKKRRSVGFGGGGPMALLIDYDLGLSGILEANGFKNLGTPLVIYGGYGMGNVGKGLFIGGMCGGTQLSQQIPYTDPNTDVQGYKRYQLDFGFGGVTVNKKFALISERVIIDFGLLLGGGQAKLTMATTDGDYSWSSVVEDMNSNAFQLEKNFMVYRPSAGIMIRVTNWFGVSTSAGYLGTYSPDNEWKESNFDFTVAGETPKAIGHPSFSIGAWFGY